MSQLRSTFNWTGRDVNGCILGEPAVDEKTGEFIWDGAVPFGEINVDGDILQKDDKEVVTKLQAVGEFRGIPSKTRPTELTKAEVLQGVVLADLKVSIGKVEKIA